MINETTEMTTNETMLKNEMINVLIIILIIIINVMMIIMMMMIMMIIMIIKINVMINEMTNQDLTIIKIRYQLQPRLEIQNLNSDLYRRPLSILNVLLLQFVVMFKRKSFI